MFDCTIECPLIFRVIDYLYENSILIDFRINYLCKYWIMKSNVEILIDFGIDYLCAYSIMKSNVKETCNRSISMICEHSIKQSLTDQILYLID